jgi:hypothetical protein
MDDILIFVQNKEELTRKTRNVLQKLQDNNLCLKSEKCEFEKEQIEFLGMVISPNNIKIDPVKLSSIRDWLMPTKVKHVQ